MSPVENNPIEIIVTQPYIENPQPLPTLPNTVSGLIGVLLGDSGDEARIVAARKLGLMGSNAEAAVPALVINLYDKNRPYEVREAAVWALGEIGTASRPAVPALPS